MKKFIIIAIATMLAFTTFAQQKNNKPVRDQKSDSPALHVKRQDDGTIKKVYDEEIDPNEQIEKALDEARSSNRLVICQVGGNWCPWCLRFADFITSDKELNTFIKKNFVYIHVNTSKEHKNYDTMKRLGNPGRFGYPVLVVLDHEGRPIQIQSTDCFEVDKSYDLKLVKKFFQNWTLNAIEEIK